MHTCLRLTHPLLHEPQQALGLLRSVRPTARQHGGRVDLHAVPSRRGAAQQLHQPTRSTQDCSKVTLPPHSNGPARSVPFQDGHLPFNIQLGRQPADSCPSQGRINRCCTWISCLSVLVKLDIPRKCQNLTLNCGMLSRPLCVLPFVVLARPDLMEGLLSPLRSYSLAALPLLSG